MTLLDVRDLTVAFPSRRGWAAAVDGVSFTVEAGTSVGLVGESGSGKTVTALSILGLTRGQGARVTGEILFDGQDLNALKEKELAEVRGGRIGMVFQQAIRTLDPSFSVGYQIAETIRRHKAVSRKDAWQQAIGLLDRVHIPDAAKRADYYPHMLSGGQCQRVMIAMALSCSPSLIIADEPTTALDVTVQSRILELLREVQSELHVAILFISHDLGVIAEMVDKVVVMYAGQVVEDARVEHIFTTPEHPYTAGLMHAIPIPGRGRRLVDIPGNVPAPGQAAAGCRFHPRCAYAIDGRCNTDPVPLTMHEGACVRCVRSAELDLDGIVQRVGER